MLIVTAIFWYLHLLFVAVDEEELTDAADKGADLELPGEEVTREKQDKQIDMEVMSIEHIKDLWSSY